MHRTRLTRIAAAAVASALVLVGLVAAPAQAAAPTGFVTGTVSSADAAVPLGTTRINVYDLTGVLRAAGSTTTSVFTIKVPVGTYRLEYTFANAAPANHVTPYWSGAATLDAAPTFVITEGATTDVGAVSVPVAGEISGSVTSTKLTNYSSSEQIGVTLMTPDGTELRYTYINGPTGTYRFAGVAAGTYLLRVQKKDHVTKFSGGAESLAGATPITVALGEVHTEDFTLVPWRLLSGTVTGRDLDGTVHPIDSDAGSGIVVRVYRLDGTAVATAYSETDGHWSLRVPADDYRIKFVNNGYKKWAEQWLGNEVTAADSDPVSIGATEDVGGVDAEMRIAATIKGTVGPASPAPGPSITVYQKDPATGDWVNAGKTYGTQFTATGLTRGVYTLYFEDKSAQAIYQSRYLGGATDIADAETITIGDAEQITGADIVLPRKPIVPFARDRDGDGNTDFLVRNPKTLRVYVEYGDGHGGIKGTALLGNGWFTSIKLFNLGDFTGGGQPDVGAFWLGAGIFRPAELYTTGYLRPADRFLTTSVKFTQLTGPGDWNGDGNADVIGRLSNGQLNFFAGDGNGHVAKPVKIATGWNRFVNVVAVGDLDGDGHPDLVTRDTGGGVWLYPGNGTGGFNPRSRIATGWKSMTAVLGVGDFTGDGHPDVMARDKAGSLWVYPGDGAGHLGSRTKVPGAFTSWELIP